MRFAILLVPTLAGAADLFIEDAAWGPLASRTTGIVALEERPVREQVVGLGVRALVIGGTRQRQIGGHAIEREDDEVVDGQVTLGWVDDLHGNESDRQHDLLNFAECSRRGLYLRLGSDPSARDSATPLVAVGGTLMLGVSGAALSVHGDAGWSDERGGLWYIEAAIPFPLPMHVIGTGDDDHGTFRIGACFRWPCGALARTPGADPWMASVALDYQASRLRESDLHRWTHGWIAEVSTSWRFAAHWYLAAYGSAQTATIEAVDDDDADAMGSASLGLGTVW